MRDVWRGWTRPVAGLLSWLAPTLAVAATTRNTLYPHLQAIWDKGEPP